MVIDKVTGSLTMCVALLGLVAGVAMAQDPHPGEESSNRALLTQYLLRAGSSPFAPPEANDSTFVVDDGPGLDTGCAFRSDGPLVFSIEVDRVIGDLDKLLDAGLISDTVVLRMPAFDVDFGAAPPPPLNPERDRVFFNGMVVPSEFLTGSDNVWKLNGFNIPIDWVNFPADPGPGNSPTPAQNMIRIDIDTANSPDEVWCTEIDWAAISIEVPRPVIMAHGILSNGNIWETVWEPRLDELGIPNDGNLDMGGLDSIQNNAVKIAEKVASSRTRWGVDKLVIGAHSKGGLDSRHYVEANQDVEQLIQLGTPNRGSRLADALQVGSVVLLGLPNTILINALAGPAGVQLTTPYMTNYNSNHGSNSQVRYTALAGDYDPDCFFLNPFCRPVKRLLLAISGSPGDTIVAVSSAHALSYTNNRTFASSGSNDEATHSGLHQSAAVFDRIEDRVMAPGRSMTRGPIPEFVSLETLGGTIQQGEVQTVSFPIDESSEAFITLLFPTGELGFELISPSGVVIDPAFADADPDIGYEMDATFGGMIAAYNLGSPELGVWTARVTGTLVTEPMGSTSYAVSGQLREPLIRLDANVASNAVQVGSPITLSATLLTAGSPVADATVSATVAGPDDSIGIVSLADDGVAPDLVANDGIFAGVFSDTALPGNYRIQMLAERSGSLAGVDFTRQQFALATVSLSNSVLTGSFNDFGLDTDGDSFFNRLVVDVGVEATAATDYRVFGTLTDSAGNTLDATAPVALSPGIASVPLSFDGDTLFQRRVDGPYTLSVVRLSEEGDFVIAVLDELFDAHATAAYTFDQFQRTALFLTGSGSSTGVDTNANSLFDRLDVTVGVNVASTAVYQWSARLTDDSGNEIGFDAGSATFAAGPNDLTFSFAGDLIGANGADGPYFISELLLFGAGESLVVGRAFQTEAFLASQFEGFVPLNLPPVALCQDILVTADKQTCDAPASIDAGSFDPDAGDTIDLVQSPPEPYPLGNTVVTLTATDDFGNSSSCQATVTVLDENAPAVSCELVPLSLSDDEGEFEVSFAVADACDAELDVQATISCEDSFAIVMLGERVEVELDDDDCEIERDDGILEIEGPDVELTVSAIDDSGNVGSCIAQPVFDDDSSDDDSSDDDSSDDDSSDDDSSDDDSDD